MNKKINKIAELVNKIENLEDSKEMVLQMKSYKDEAFGVVDCSIKLHDNITGGTRLFYVSKALSEELVSIIDNMILSYKIELKGLGVEL